jgi:hypothetical protein
MLAKGVVKDNQKLEKKLGGKYILSGKHDLFFKLVFTIDKNIPV